MWLLDPQTKQRLDRAYDSGLTPSAEQQVEFEARVASDDNSMPRILTIAGNTAEIGITGVLTQKPDFMAKFFGGGNTTYGEIISSIAIAEADDSVNKIVFAVDSPGGSINGLFDAVAAINGATKPTEAIVLNQAASAAYALVAQADSITATNKMSMVGSIGIVASFSVDSERVDVTSTEAPNKRPDVTTEAGKAIVREQLDAMHDLFVDAIAEGRKTTSKDVNANFGQGGVLLAEDAVKRGMIDGVEGQLSKPKPAAKQINTADAGGAQLEAKGMTKQELMAQHPELFSAVMEDGSAAGVTGERERVSAHLIWGEASGDTTTAFAAIKEGTDLTPTLLATYQTAQANQSALAAREGDNVADLKAPVIDDAATVGKNILALAAEQCGVEVI